MTKFKIYCSTLLLLLFFSSNLTYSQRFLQKLQDKVEDKIIDDIFDESGNKSTNSNSNANESQNTSQSSMQNTKGEGLSGSQYDVDQSIESAKTTYNDNNYLGAKSSIRQAIQGIEIEMGKEVLKSLPETIKELSIVKEDDKVTSTSIGFAGLTIERRYQSKNQELNITIANNSPLLTSINMYLANGYVASTDEKNNYKNITFQGNQATIQYDDNSGYTLSVPFGQNSIMVVNGINFEKETEFMSAANTFEIEKIKSQLQEK